MANEWHERPWWQEGPRAAFNETVSSMATKDLERLIGEMAGVLADMQGQIATRRAPEDAVWRQRAIRAQSLIASRKQTVKAELQVRNNERQEANMGQRAILIAAAREATERGDLAEALSLVLDLLEGKHKP